MTVRISDDLIVSGSIVGTGVSVADNSITNSKIAADAAIGRSKLAQDSNAVYPIKLTDFRIWDSFASVLPGTSAADDLALDGGAFGTDSPKLTTGDVKTLTVTRYARVQAQLPPEYVSGETCTLRIHAAMETTISDGAATVDAEVFESDKNAGIGADLCTTAAQSINSLTWATYDFTVDPSGLSAGDVLDIRIAVSVTDSATATAVIASIGSVELLLDVKG